MKKNIFEYIDKFLTVCKSRGIHGALADSQKFISRKANEILLRNFHFISKNIFSKNKTAIQASSYNIHQDPAPDYFNIPKFDSIDVTIIIPVYNNFDLTINCLWSIVKNTKDIAYEIIIADDNSTDKTKNINKYVENIVHIVNKINIGFLKNCNNAASYAQGEYIAFLNNDTLVQANWLGALVATLKKDHTIGLVGSKLIFGDGTLQEAGGIIFKNASGLNYGRNDNPNKLEYNYLKEVDYISGASLMLSKALWEKVGGFDESFAPAYYEDTDLAFKIRYNEGLKVVYQPNSVVMHLEGKSNGTDCSSGIKKYQVINRLKFYNKWKKELHKFHAIDESQLYLARDHAIARKNVLVIDYKILSFSKDAGSRATYQYMKFFKNCDFNVKFYPDSFYVEDNFLQIHLNDGFEVICDNFTNWIKNNGKFIDIIYLNRPDISVYYIDKIRKYTNAKVIYQGHDLHYLRKYRQNVLDGVKNAQEIMLKEKNFELDICRKMDVACYFSSTEINILKEEDPYIYAKAIPLFIYDPDSMRTISYNSMERDDMVFVAGFQHDPNIDAAIWFCKKIFPKIISVYPDIKFYLVGNNPPPEVQKLASKNIIVTGYVTDQKLKEIYRSIRLAVVPLRYGAGIKGKIIEAIFNKVPVVTTGIGIEGILNENNFISVAENELDFSRTVVQLYTNYNQLDAMSNQCLNYIEHYFSARAARAILSEIVDDISIEQGESQRP